MPKSAQPTAPTPIGRRMKATRHTCTQYTSSEAHPTSAQRGAAIRAAFRGKFTQVQLAEILGVAQNTISRWSTGDVEPSLDGLIRLEDVCGFGARSRPASSRVRRRTRFSRGLHRCRSQSGLSAPQVAVIGLYGGPPAISVLLGAGLITNPLCCVSPDCASCSWVPEQQALL